MNHDCTKKHLLLFLIIGCFVGRCWILNNTRIFCEEVESPNSLKNRESLRITMGFLNFGKDGRLAERTFDKTSFLLFLLL